MQKAPPDLCEYLAWDSEHFGYRIARLLPSQLSAEVLARGEDWCRSNRIECLYWLADADDARTVRLAEQHDFSLVDVRMTLSKKLAEPGTGLNRRAVGTIRPALARDLPALRTIARQSHHDTRFYFDPHFAAAKCDALYEIWIAKSIQGYADAVLVADWEDRVVGYVTCKSLDLTLGQIGLLAVDGGAVGLGFGSALITVALDWFRERGHQRVRVVTQGRNTRAQRCYQRAGFVTEAVRLSYHRWFLPASDKSG
jgi:dTDP-4-amino-4,6-dideoxy-D-galactose acyltransferase